MLNKRLSSVSFFTVWLLLWHAPHRIRVPYPFQWGPPTFDAGEAFAMMMASFVALVEVCQPNAVGSRLVSLHDCLNFCMLNQTFLSFWFWSLFLCFSWKNIDSCLVLICNCLNGIAVYWHILCCDKVCQCHSDASFNSQSWYRLAGNTVLLAVTCQILLFFSLRKYIWCNQMTIGCLLFMLPLVEKQEKEKKKKKQGCYEIKLVIFCCYRLASSSCQVLPWSLKDSVDISDCRGLVFC